MVKRGTASPLDSGGESPGDDAIVAQPAKKSHFSNSASGFSSGGFSGQELFAQVAAAKASTTELMKSMKGSNAEPQSLSSAHLLQTREVAVGENLIPHLMTSEHKRMILEESGADVEWLPEEKRARLQGSPDQLRHAARLMARVEMHCHWGVNAEKVRRLLRRPKVESVLCRLSPMTVGKLKSVDKMLSAQDPNLSVGKDRSNDLVITDAVASRQHCVLSYDASKGAVYVADLSTNGTWLNGKRLPSRKLGKVLLSHGDELLLKDPDSGDMEFGYMCNLKEMSVRTDTDLKAPRRLLTAEESALGKGVA
mmetsp:Transcript_57752/g.137472  ORF Transcript_57752/g.137472 Transcript_57752/m.137472 type:complete len:309 (-) Transcript_57752:42-968(-)